METQIAKLMLEDGSVFSGTAIGAARSVSGEVVFNTGMVGYPEAFTDPSYKGQILTLTYPLIGNYGVPDDAMEHGLKTHFESDRIHISGLVVSSLSKEYNHWNASRSLNAWLREEGIPGIEGIDTRALTKKLRERGVMLGKIVFDGDVALEDPNTRNLVAEVSTREKIVYNAGAKKKILLIDCGVKHNIIRSLISRNVSVVRVPWDYNFLNEEYDGIVISNGPGDPKMCEKTIKHLAEALRNSTPIFGICLGNQLLALAAGGNTYKLKYGHRGQNQPCISGERCFITSQNHGFAVDEKSLGEEWRPFFRNANDGTNEGLVHATKPFMSVQFHPEATPGPSDTNFLFDQFLSLVKKRAHA